MDKKAAKEFAERWKDKGYEKGQSQQFWIDLLENVMEVDNITEFISFEDKVMLDHTSFIDGYIKSTHVMIEQKSIGKDLRKGIKQSDGTLLSPFQQAKRYSAELPYSQRPRWIITCNFAEFLIYDMEKPNGEPEQIFLKDLPKEAYRLQFMVEQKSEIIKKEEEISIEAGNIVGKLYDALRSQYAEPDNPETLKSLNKLCVRLVFCLYAEDADIFGKHQMFHDYMKRFSARDFRKALIELFEVLDTKPEERDKYMDDELAAFPYVNGGLFADENIEIPRFTDEIVDLILVNASEEFDWSGISPVIFGAVFESTLNPETRRSGGMHYTSVDNIRKVICPLFLDELTNELNDIKEKYKVEKTRKAKLEEFRDKLASLTFLDPACGSGNFLTQTYMELRKLENEALRSILGGQKMFGGEVITPVKVGISQFYGIEINDFAVTVAKTALWIAEAQMLQETENIVENVIPFLPLKSYANIAEGNALRIDWESVVPKDKLSYIMGNPPFVGYSLQSNAQKQDIQSIYVDSSGKTYKTAGKNDYVACWYFKAAQLMVDTSIRTAFVSTNSITQGEQVAGVWKPLYDRFGIHIDFAHRTFRWDSEASLKAHVHCVIVGFSIAENKADKRLYDNGTDKVVKIINPYLIDTDIVFVEDRKSPLCKGVTIMNKGSQGTDDGAFYFTPDEYDLLIKKYPDITSILREATNGQTFINNSKRYCLWCENVSPAELRKYPEIIERVQMVKKFRLASTKEATRKWADYPYLFTENRQPKSGNYLLLPLTSSERRRYVPIGYLPFTVIANNSVQIIPDASLFDFGILTSNVFMAWMRVICGRLKSDYRITVTNVYNNFPWCTPTDEQKAAIEKTAQMILDARAKYPESSLADLYDELTMPPELRKAHQANDKAVMSAYGFDYKTMTESECVAELMKMYQNITQ